MLFAGALIVPIKKSASPPREGKPQDSGLQVVHADSLVQPTVMQQALLEALKTRGEPIPPPLFVVLGYRVRPETTITIKSDEIFWESDMSTLYLVQQGTCLSREQERLIIKPPKEPQTEVPIREVEQILVFGNIQLTTAVISTCLELQIPVIF